MGLLDALLGNIAGAGSSAQSPLVGAALQFIQQQGGLPGVINKFEQGSMGAQARSWVGGGANMPITGAQLQEILGTGSIGQIAQQLGLSHGDASANLAQLLPHVIDHLTPAGQIPADHADTLTQALSTLSKQG